MEFTDFIEANDSFDWACRLPNNHAMNKQHPAIVAYQKLRKQEPNEAFLDFSLIQQMWLRVREIPERQPSDHAMVLLRVMAFTFLLSQGFSDDLLAGRVCFGLLDRITLSDGSDIDLWSARDALLLKAMTIVLVDILPVSPRCTHIKGHGGAKLAVRQVAGHLAANSFVMRTDVKSFYASIDHLRCGYGRR